MTDAPRNSRARWIVLTAIVAVILVGAGLFAFRALRPGGGPADTAERYFLYLQQGRAQAALALTTTSTPPNGALLTDAAYRKADRKIAHVDVGTMTRDGDSASGTVSYTLHGKPQTARITLSSTNGGFLRQTRWRITSQPLGTLRVRVAGQGHASSLSIDGTTLAVTGDGTIAIPVLPGRYQLKLGSDTKMLTSAPQQVDLAGGSSHVSLGLTPSAAFGRAAVAKAQTELTGCFAQPTLASTCAVGQGIRNLFDLTAEETVTYQLVGAPTLSFDAKTMQVVSDATGEIVATPTDGRWGTFQNKADFDLTFDVTVGNDGAPTLTPDQGGITLVRYEE